MIHFLLTVLLTTTGLLIALVIYSFIRTAGGRRYNPAFYEQDKFRQPGQFVKRRYRSFSHFLFRLADTLGYTYPLLRVFGFHTISPAFREKIFLATAISNDCSQ